MDLSSMPAFIEQSHGIAGDRRNLLDLLDQEASSIAEQEDLEADQHIEAELAAFETGEVDMESPVGEDIDDAPEIDG
jgi:hypothetical protein